jgi:hypothetical protein
MVGLVILDPPYLLSDVHVSNAIDVKVTGNVGTIVLNRPDRRNGSRARCSPNSPRPSATYTSKTRPSDHPTGPAPLAPGWTCKKCRLPPRSDAEKNQDFGETPSPTAKSSQNDRPPQSPRLGPAAPAVRAWSSATLSSPPPPPNSASRTAAASSPASSPPPGLPRRRHCRPLLLIHPHPRRRSTALNIYHELIDDTASGPAAQLGEECAAGALKAATHQTPPLRNHRRQ